MVIFGLVTSLISINSAQAQSTEILLSVSKEKIKLKTPFTVNVAVSSNENTLGTDLKLSFDPDKLELLEVVPGEVYPNFSNPESLTEANGEIYLSGVAEITKGIVPNGNLASINFQSKSPGKTEINVVYDLSNTTSTAVIPFEGDEVNLLTQAPEPLVIEIKKASWWQRLWQFFKDVWMDTVG